MIAASKFWQACLKHNFSFVTETPCSYLKPLINAAIENEALEFLDATNEELR